uniref:Uncharacterized protein n=1 Tax=Panagrolaimus sp. ES5 TaxID=591445 RepID=A0AC34GVE1_9BILA
MGNGSSNDRGGRSGSSNDTGGGYGGGSSTPARKRSFRDGERNLRGFSNALDNRFEGNQTYDKTVRPYMHEKYHDYSAEKNCEKKDWEAARNDKFNAERHYRTRHDIPQSYDEHGKFKKEEYITERQERENQEKYGKK